MGFELLAINIEPSQDASGRDLFKSHHYTFAPLAMPDPNFCDRYNVHEAPTNFLLDRQGRIVLKPTFDSDEARATSEGEIKALLERK